MTTTLNAPDAGTRRRNRVTAVGAAVAAALVVWVVAAPVLRVDLAVPSGTQTMQIGVGLVIVNALVAALAGWALLALLERFTSRPRTVWTVVAVLTLLVSFNGPLVAAGAASTATKLTLAAMHLAVGAVLIPMLAGATQDRSRS